MITPFKDFDRLDPMEATDSVDGEIEFELWHRMWRIFNTVDIDLGDVSVLCKAVRQETT